MSVRLRADRERISLSARHFQRCRAATRAERHPGPGRRFRSPWHCRAQLENTNCKTRYTSLNAYTSAGQKGARLPASVGFLCGRKDASRPDVAAGNPRQPNTFQSLYWWHLLSTVLIWLYIQIYLTTMEDLAQDFWPMAECIWLFLCIHRKRKIYSFKYTITYKSGSMAAMVWSWLVMTVTSVEICLITRLKFDSQMVQTWFTMCNSTEINTTINTDTWFYLVHNLYSEIIFKCGQLKKKNKSPPFS